VSGEEGEVMGFNAGASDYIIKPVRPSVLLSRISAHLQNAHHKRILEKTVAARTYKLQTMSRDAIRMLAQAGHYNDSDTGEHIWRMARYSRIICESLGIDRDKCGLLESAAPMHDAGKIGIPDAILKKPGQLSDQEWVIMRTHTTIGHGILSKSTAPIFVMAAEIANSHHEKWDGTGYPTGASKKAIRIWPRIVAVADVFDALTMKRPYKDPWSPEKAVAKIRQGAGNHFDPRIVDSFISSLPQILEDKNKFG